MNDGYLPFHWFDRAQDTLRIERRLPHWAQAGTMTFITWRTWDSVSPAVVKQWQAERSDILRRHGIHGNAKDWRQKLRLLPPTVQSQLQWRFSEQWNEYLDRGRGSCVLRDPELAQLVARSLLHFDDVRYLLTDFVVMPNHVHLLAAFSSEDEMLKQCESWKHYTAARINRRLGRRGRFWQSDGFDHLIRTAEQYQYRRSYIADNGRRANLTEDEYLHYSKPLDFDGTLADGDAVNG